MVKIESSKKLHFQIIEDQKINTPSTQQEFEIDGPDAGAYVMGRSDISSNYKPDIDMTPFNGQDYGISRRHAVLLRYEGTVHIMDLGSMNGTFVNEQRLSPHVPIPLEDGAKIGLGNLQMSIECVKPKKET